MAEKDKAGKKKKPDISSRAQDKKLTFINEAPVSDNNISLTAGPRGAMAMQDIWYQEKLAHFDREVIPGRRMHAKGSGAFGKIHRGPRHHEIYEGKSRPCTKNSKVRHTVHCYLTDKDYGTRLAKVLKLDMTAIEELAKLGNKELLYATLADVYTG